MPSLYRVTETIKTLVAGYIQTKRCFETFKESKAFSKGLYFSLLLRGHFNQPKSILAFLTKRLGRTKFFPLLKVCYKLL